MVDWAESTNWLTASFWRCKNCITDLDTIYKNSGFIRAKLTPVDIIPLGDLSLHDLFPLGATQSDVKQGRATLSITPAKVCFTPVTENMFCDTNKISTHRKHFAACTRLLTFVQERHRHRCKTKSVERVNQETGDIAKVLAKFPLSGALSLQSFSQWVVNALQETLPERPVCLHINFDCEGGWRG